MRKKCDNTNTYSRTIKGVLCQKKDKGLLISDLNGATNVLKNVQLFLFFLLTREKAESVSYASTEENL